MFVCTAIFYNHDSPRRTEDYLLNKIARSAIRIANGEQDKLLLGNLKMGVDIGYAKEYMEAANDMMQLDEPSDYVIATEAGFSIGYLARSAFITLGHISDWKDADNLIGIDPKFYRPGNQPTLIGDCSKAKEKFGFHAKYDAARVIQLLMEGITGNKINSDLPELEHQI